MLSEIFLAQDHLPEQAVFDGYAFFGTTFVCGMGGYLDAVSSGQNVKGVSDGCYIRVESHDGGWRISTDFAGHRKIFLYRSGNYWAASTSFYRLAREMRDRGRPLTISLPQYHGLNGKHSFCQQIASCETIFTEVSLLPLGVDLVVSEEMAHEVPSEATDERLTMRDFLIQWAGRLGAFLGNADTTINCNLSGGLDSRVVTSLLNMSLKTFDSEISCDVKFNTNPTPVDPADYIVAKEVAKFLCIDLTEGAPPIRPGRITARNSFERWRDRDLATYLPFYPPIRNFDQHLVTLSGGGGECFRPFFNEGTFKATAEFIEDPIARESWKRSTMSAAKNLMGTTDPIHHYCNYRNRFHFGCLAQGQVMIQPLSSMAMHALKHYEAADRQVYFDIMESCASGLSMIPFDKPEKSPSTENMDLLEVSTIRRDDIEIGKMILTSEDAGYQTQSDGETVFDVYSAEAEKLMRDERIGSLLGPIKDSALRFIDEQSDLGRFPTGTRSTALTRALSLGTCLDLALSD